MTKKVSKILLYAVASVVLFVGVLVLYTQTSAFRSNLRSVLYQVVRSELNASVYIGEIRGNFFSGFSIDTLMVYVDNAPFVETGRIAVRYDILRLLGTTVSIDSVSIENPSVHLFRFKDSTWNVDHLVATPPSPDSTPSSLILDVRSLRLTNGRFALADSTGDLNARVTIDGRTSMNYANMKMDNIMLDAHGIYSARTIAATINRLSLRSPRERFSLDRLSMSVGYTKDSVQVRDLAIVTPRSNVRVDARLSAVDVFAIGDLKDFRTIPTSVEVARSTVAMEDLHTFLPELYFLKGSVALNASFAGTFEQLNVRKLDAAFAKTSLHLTGFVSNLHDPGDLRLNIVSKNSTINPPDVPELLPYFNIPNYTDLGMMTVDFQYVGKPLDFMAVTTVRSAAGQISVDGEMIITENDIHYKGLLAGRDVRLEKLYPTADLITRLNTKTYIEGKGTSIDRLQAEAKVELDSSSINGIDVSSATLDVSAQDRRVHSTLAVSSPEGSLHTTGTIDFQRAFPSYTVAARARNVNLARLVKDDYYTSDLSFDLDRSADRFALMEGNATTRIDVLPSHFRHERIDSSTVTLSMTADSSDRKKIFIQSPVVDGTISGFFTLQGLLSTLESGIRRCGSIYSYQRHVIDSTFIRDDLASSDRSADSTSVDVDYHLQLKNAAPVALLLKIPSLEVAGTVDGRLRGNDRRPAMDGTVMLQRFDYEQDSTDIRGRHINVEYDMQGSENWLRFGTVPLRFAVKTDADELLINSTLFRNLSGSIDALDTVGHLLFSSDIDTTISVGLQAGVHIGHNGERFDIDRFDMKYQGYEFGNDGIVRLELNDKGIRVDSAIFSHDKESVLVTGHYRYNGEIDVSAAVRNFDISNIHYFESSPEYRQGLMLFGGTVNARASVTGTAGDPVIAVAVDGDSLTYQKTGLGSLSAVLDYAKKLASVKVEMTNTNDTASVPGAVVSGTIPVDLSFSSVPRRLGQEGLHLSVVTTTLQFSALDPFIPELITSGGSIRSRFDVTGSLEHPSIAGTASLEGGRFVLEMNGLLYTATGTLTLDGNRITFDTLTVANTASDYAVGAMHIGGFILLEGFVPHDYHLRAQGELMVLSERSQATGSKFFGTLVASTGSDSLRFDGNFDRSRVTGIVYVEQASLTFPPTQQALNYSTSVFKDVEFVDDTSRHAADSLLIEQLAHAIQQAKILPRLGGRTFLDGFGYDLTIQTHGSARVNMIFNANAGAYEELYAVLNGKLVLTKNEEGLQLKGTINVGNESNYTFYKTFNATGALTFLGDPQNPQLDIVATYEGTHLPDPKATAGTEETAVVTLNITGTRSQPKIKLGLKTIDKNGKETERTGDVENDAISFLLTSSPGVPGKFREELSAEDRNRISDQLTSTIGGTFVNSLLSGYVIEFIQKNNIPFVKTFEVRKVVEADPEIKIGAEVLSAYVNVGGRVFSNPNNTNISVQIPLGDRQKRNFMLEVEKKTENFEFSNQARTIIDARIFYRFTF